MCSRLEQQSPYYNNEISQFSCITLHTLAAEVWRLNIPISCSLQISCNTCLSSSEHSPSHTFNSLSMQQRKVLSWLRWLLIHMVLSLAVHSMHFQTVCVVLTWFCYFHPLCCVPVKELLLSLWRHRFSLSFCSNVNHQNCVNLWRAVWGCEG